MLRRLRGLVLHRTPLREKDRVVEVFAREEGLRRMFAPGVRHVASRRAGHLEPFMVSALVVATSRRGDVVRDARVLHPFPHLREHLPALRVAYAIVRTLREQLREGVADRLLYDAIQAIFRALDTPGVPARFLFDAAVLHLLRSLGLLPDLYRCSHCRRRLGVGEFSLRSAQRGFWCVRCGGRGDPVLTDVVRLSRLLLASPVPPRQLKVSDPVVRRFRALLRMLLPTAPPARPLRTGRPLLRGSPVGSRSPSVRDRVHSRETRVWNTSRFSPAGRSGA